MPRQVKRIAFVKPYRYKIMNGEGPRLYKFVQSCTITFDPFYEKARALREIHRQLASSLYQKANPKAELKLNVHKGALPALNIKYIDGSDISIENLEEDDAKTILSQVFFKATNVRFDYLLDNKPLP